MNDRVLHVNQLIKKEISNIILKRIDIEKDSFVTITRVETSSNLIQSKVYISVLPETKTGYVFKSLNKDIFNLQQELNKRLKMRPVPKILFKKEEKTKEAGRVEEILESIKKGN